MLSFIRMFRGTFHMMLFRLNASSHATVIEELSPSPRPAVWSVRRPPPNRNTGKNISLHRRARDNRDPLLERIVERLQVRPQGADGVVEPGLVVALRGGAQRGQVVRRPLEALDHRVVVLVQPVELLLLDADRRAEAGVALLRVPDPGLHALELEDHVPEVREADHRGVLGGGLPGRLELRPEVLHLAVDLDPEQVVRRADVLAPPVPRVSRDPELDLLDQPAVGLDAFTDVGDVCPSRCSSPNSLLCESQYFNVLVVFPRRS